MVSMDTSLMLVSTSDVTMVATAATPILEVVMIW